MVWQFCQAIKKIGCVSSSVDHLVFTMHKDSSSMALIVYVDDILIAGSDKMVLKIQTASPTLSLWQRSCASQIFFKALNSLIRMMVLFFHREYVLDLLAQWNGVYRIPHYLKSFLSNGLCFKSLRHLKVARSSDANYASSRDLLKYCTYIGGNFITWCRKKHAISRSNVGEQ